MTTRVVQTLYPLSFSHPDQIRNLNNTFQVEVLST
jgi:hypothetical protein